METVAAAASAQVYRSRHPERTVLYRGLAQHFERFLLVYEERFQRAHGYLRRCVEPAIHRCLDCGVFDQGVARVRCPDCRHGFSSPSPASSGPVPELPSEARASVGEWAELNLLEDIPHRKVVVTIPKRLRIFFRYDLKLLGELAGCAWRARKL